MDTVKHCVTCDQDKLQSDFYKRAGRKCKRCVQAQNIKNGHWKYKGINIDRVGYNLRFVEQKGCCAICDAHQSELPKSLVVDHDHATGEVRGLLCDHCNWALGNTQDKPARLRRAAEYLESFYGVDDGQTS